MGRQAGPHFITGTIGNRCYYKLNGKYYVRAKSSLSRRRVKRSPAFRHTMVYAERLAQASRIASGIYRLFEKDKRKVQLYRAMTGKAIDLLKTGMAAASIQTALMHAYRSYLQQWVLDNITATDIAFSPETAVVQTLLKAEDAAPVKTTATPVKAKTASAVMHASNTVSGTPVKENITTAEDKSVNVAGTDATPPTETTSNTPYTAAPQAAAGMPKTRPVLRVASINRHIQPRPGSATPALLKVCN